MSVAVTSFLHSPRGRALVVLLRLVVAAMFLVAALPKIADPTTFATDLDNYRLLPDALIGPTSVGLPLLETVVALALLTGVHGRGAALVAGGMLLVFALGMVQAIARGIDLDCGCFGHVVETRVSWLTVARNVALTIACVVIVRGPDLPLWPLSRRSATG